MSRLIDALLVGGGTTLAFALLGAFGDWLRDRWDVRRAERRDWAPWADLQRRSHGRRA